MRISDWSSDVCSSDLMPLSRRDPIAFEGASRAWKQALDVSGLTLDDLSLVETHDCFTIAELIEYEAKGLAKRGEGNKVVREGNKRNEGGLPVTPHGGRKSNAPPRGATRLSTNLQALSRRKH